MTGIYFIRSKCKPDRIYVGSAVDIQGRFRQHKSHLRNNKHHSKKLQNHVNKYGIEDLDFIAMVVGVEKEELIPLEQDCLDSFKPYFNISLSANNPMLGRKHSKRTKIKLSETQSGKEHSKETKAKLSESKKGKKLSEETKLKISGTLTGRYKGKDSPHYDHTIYHFRHHEHGDRFCTRFELRKEFNLNEGFFNSVVRGVNDNHKGWRLIK